jgi:acetolactate synthase-1/2/3 large subunit
MQSRPPATNGSKRRALTETARPTAAPGTPMTGAEALVVTLLANGVTACFANPGTSEMQFVTALDRRPSMRPVLCQFEGVATGAADGYGRMADGPACTLLHLGPGYANGAANLHNARRAFTPVVNIIGDHATYHRHLDAPLNSDIEALVRPNSVWQACAATPDAIAPLAAQAIAASLGPPGGPVSLILPADCAWSPTGGGPVIAPRPLRPPPPAATVDAAAHAIRAAVRPIILIGGRACRAEGLAQAARLQAGGVEVLAETFIPRLARGAGAFAPRRLSYFAELAAAELAGCDLIVLAGADAPVAFFAYPGLPNVLVPEGCVTQSLVGRGEDAALGLAALADALDAPVHGPRQGLAVAPAAPCGPLDTERAGVSIARHLPEAAIICDDSLSARPGVTAACLSARPHEILALTGGAIGIGLPMAVGAAIAAPGRKVVSLNGDGAAMYTLQALWTMARENLDITVVVFANHIYRTLLVEVARTGAGVPGPAARKLLYLDDPKVQWVPIAHGMGLPAVRCETAEAFDAAFAAAMSQRGPTFIEAAIG